MWLMFTLLKSHKKLSISNIQYDSTNYGAYRLHYFCRRIAFCLDVYNEAVKSMRYPPDAYRKELAAQSGTKDREDEKTIEELIKELEDDMEE
jgi:hypothetical protein